MKCRKVKLATMQVPMAAEGPGSLQEGLPASRLSASQHIVEAVEQRELQLPVGREDSEQWIRVASQEEAAGFVWRDPGPQFSSALPLRKTLAQASALAASELKRLPKLRSRRGSDLSEEEFRGNYIDSLRVTDSSPAASRDRQSRVLIPLPPKIKMDPRFDFPAPNIPPSFADDGVNPVASNYGYDYPFAAAQYLTQNPEQQLPIVNDVEPFCGSRPVTVSNEDAINVLSKALTAVVEDTSDATSSEAVDLPRKSSESFRSHIKSVSSPGGKSSAHQSHKTHGSHVLDAKRKRILRKAHQVAVAKENGVEEEWPDPLKYNASTEFRQSLHNPMRRFAIRCIEWPMWDKCVLLLILINTIQLSLYDPMVRGNNVL